MNRVFTIGVGRLDLFPACVGVAPEGRPVAGIQNVQALVALLQPGTKLTGACLAIAGAAVFVGDMPRDQCGMVVIALCQATSDLLGEIAIVGRGGTKIDSVPMMAA